MNTGPSAIKRDEIVARELQLVRARLEEQARTRTAQEVASRNITVNVVAPGLIETDMTRAITDGARDDWAAKLLGQRP